MDNKRSLSREPMRSRARLLVDGQWHDCMITNSTAVGVRLYLRMNIETGKAVHIEIGELGPYDATVVWREGDEIGLRLDHDPEEIATILGVLNS